MIIVRSKQFSVVGSLRIYKAIKRIIVKIYIDWVIMIWKEKMFHVHEL